jgi:hypothetical protein
VEVESSKEKKRIKTKHKTQTKCDTHRFILRYGRFSPVRFSFSFLHHTRGGGEAKKEKDGVGGRCEGRAVVVIVVLRHLL